MSWGRGEKQNQGKQILASWKQLRGGEGVVKKSAEKANSNIEWGATQRCDLSKLPWGIDVVLPSWHVDQESSSKEAVDSVEKRRGTMGCFLSTACDKIYAEEGEGGERVRKCWVNASSGVNYKSVIKLSCCCYSCCCSRCCCCSWLRATFCTFHVYCDIML